MLDVLRETGCKAAKACVVLPVATGMAMLLCILHLKGKRPQSRIVIWPRIDQKTCIKAPQTAGCQLIVVEPLYEGDSLVTDVGRVKELLVEHSETVTCVLSTTSCFAPRTPDKLVALAELCAEYNVPHVVNNAYGIQSTRCMGLLNTAATKGRVDLFVQSLDKNFMVPVGGSVVAGFTQDSVTGVCQTYPGRGSSAPVLDLFITLLAMGRQGLRGLLDDRVKVFAELKQQLSILADKYNERVLDTTHNQISLAFTLGNSGKDNTQLTEIGSKLFQRNVTGARVVTPGTTKTIGAVTFTNFGSHSNDYPVPYITFAASVGMRVGDVGVLVEKLDKVLSKVYKEVK